MDKRWTIRESAPSEAREKFLDLPPFVVQLLWNRGIVDKKEVDEFLKADYEADLHDPFLFQDMERAVERIFVAIEKKEKIVIFGDYDADGVTGTAILVLTLKALGAAPEIYIPHREKEGYGINETALQYLADKGTQLIITCDLGISNTPEAEIARGHNIDLIITDHHTLPTILPKAYAVIHPRLPGGGYPYPHLTGGAVAWKLAVALLSYAERTQKEKRPALGFEKWLLDFVAISTVADVGKLIGENRTLTKYGLVVLNKTKRLGLRKLFDSAHITAGNLDTGSIAFQITPRLNAAGRMDHANTAFQLLISEDEVEATRLAEDLQVNNQDRQRRTDQIVAEARKMIGTAEGKHIIMAYHPSWSLGVLGIAASRIVEEYGRPAVLASKNEAGNIVGSARSIDALSIIDAFKDCQEHILRFGGHPKAGGFSLKSENEWPVFVGALEAIAFQKLVGVDVRSEIIIDAEISIEKIDWELWGMIAQLEPFGEGNPRPKFLIKNCEILTMDRIGDGGKHVKFTITDDSRISKKAIGFSFSKQCEQFTIGERIDVVAELSVNEWNGDRNLELKLVDVRLSEADSIPTV